MTRLLLLLAALAGTTTAAGVLAARHAAALLGAMGESASITAMTAGPLLGLLVTALGPACALWVLVTTFVEVLDRLRGRNTDRRGTPAFVRRMVEQAIGGVLLLGTMAGPAAAAVPVPPSPGALTTEIERQATDAPPAGPTPSVTGVPPTGVPPITVPPAGTMTIPLRPPSPAPVTPVPDAGAIRPGGQGTVGAPETDAPATHVVASGENLWVIARGHLIAQGVAAPADRQVHAVWVRLIADNLASLRSGDPDLIHPGEVLDLPAPGTA